MHFEGFKDILLLINALVAIFMVGVHLKNSRLQRSNYLIGLKSSKSNSTSLDFIESKQQDGNFIVKLAFYNPSSTAAIIRALIITKTIHHPNFILNQLGFKKEVRVDYRWSPALDNKEYEVVYLKDAYPLLHVKTVVTLYASISGSIDRDIYHFEIRTNHNWYKQSCYIDGKNHMFATNYEEW